MSFPSKDAILIADMFAVCSETCREAFILSHPEALAQQAKLRGLSFPTARTREALLKFAACL